MLKGIFMVASFSILATLLKYFSLYVYFEGNIDFANNLTKNVTSQSSYAQKLEMMRTLFFVTLVVVARF